ncbi:hypothetical protein GCM10010327_39650 [Streptomyces nitrosporeus]|nr:hypothetical protein GCM10010327_39650 [Streptomyces nitrosporeus]
MHRVGGVFPDTSRMPSGALGAVPGSRPGRRREPGRGSVDKGPRARCAPARATGRGLSRALRVIARRRPGGWEVVPSSLGSWAMAHNPHAPQPGPEGSHDPAGSTQMFRAFVDDGEPQRRQQTAAASSGPKAGVIVAIVAVIVVLGAVAWLALG